MNYPLVSVVLPTYNRAGLLARSIGSVLAQSVRDLELVVVDDGSRDNTRDVVAAFGDPRIRYVHRSNGGVAAARNTGVSAARGKYLAFQDSDDEWLLDKLERQLATLESTDGSAMCVCGMMRIMGSRRIGQRIFSYPRAPSDWKSGLDHRRVIRSAVAYTQSWLVPRQSVLDVGGFREDLSIWDDWELLIRLSMRLDIRLMKEPLVISERMEDSLSLDTNRFLHDMELILRDYSRHLQQFPDEHAHLYYLHALRFFRAGQSHAARTAIRCSLRYAPVKIASWKLALRILAGVRARSAMRSRITDDQ